MRSVRVASSLVLTLCLGAGPAPAEDPAGNSPLRLYAVGALTMGRIDFIPRGLGLVIGGEGPYDQLSHEVEPPTLPVGTVDEIVEVVLYQVDPGSWESVAGAFVRPMGNETLLVRQQPEALAGVGQAIRRMEDRWLRPITLDVVAVRLPPTLGSAPSAEELAALAASDTAGPALSLTAFPTQRVSAFSGRQIAYLQDYDVEVAQKAKISDPMLGVVNVGLSVSARASASEAGDRVRVDLNAELVELLRMDAISAGDGRLLDAPVLGSTITCTTALLSAGVWTLLEGSGPRAEGGGTAFLARARVGTCTAGAPTQGLSLPVLDSAGMGKLQDRALSIARRTDPIPSRDTPQLDILAVEGEPLLQSERFPEPVRADPPDGLVEFIRQAIAPEAWGARGGSAEVKNGTLYLRAPETALLAVERLFTALEQAQQWATEVEGRLVEVAGDSQVLANPLLEPDAEAALIKALADGSAVLLERLCLNSLAGQRNSVTALEERAYLQDYEVEIAEDAVIANPIVRILRGGVVLDLHPQITSARDSVVVAVRLNRSVPFQALRLVKTMVGDIQCPDMRVHELRTDVEIPFGRTAVVGSFAAQGGRRTALLLTPRLTRPAR